MKDFCLEEQEVPDSQAEKDAAQWLINTILMPYSIGAIEREQITHVKTEALKLQKASMRQLREAHVRSGAGPQKPCVRRRPGASTSAGKKKKKPKAGKPEEEGAMEPPRTKLQKQRMAAAQVAWKKAGFKTSDEEEKKEENEEEAEGEQTAEEPSHQGREGRSAEGSGQKGGGRDRKRPAATEAPSQQGTGGASAGDEAPEWGL